MTLKKSGKEALSYKEAIRKIKLNWPSIKLRLEKRRSLLQNKDDQYYYPISKRLELKLDKSISSKVHPKNFTLNKIFKLMDWNYEVKYHDANFDKEKLHRKLLRIEIIKSSFHLIDRNRFPFAENTYYFFQDTIRKGAISKIYFAPSIDTLDKILKHLQKVENQAKK